MQNIKYQYEQDKQHKARQTPKQPWNPDVFFPYLVLIQPDHIFINFFVRWVLRGQRFLRGKLGYVQLRSGGAVIVRNGQSFFATEGCWFSVASRIHTFRAVRRVFLYRFFIFFAQEIGWGSSHCSCHSYDGCNCRIWGFAWKILATVLPGRLLFSAICWFVIWDFFFNCLNFSIILISTFLKFVFISANLYPDA